MLIEKWETHCFVLNWKFKMRKFDALFHFKLELCPVKIVNMK